jgi:arylsulfatase
MSRPNVVVILADDLGYSDIAAFGGEIDTPHLDRLAGRGVRMSSYYFTPRCSPSRAALLTGRHPHSTGIGVLTTNNSPKGYPGSLSLDVPTLAERLQDHGYTSGLFGKWHLASEFVTPSPTWPTRRGFDQFRGILPGATSFYQPPLVQQETRVPQDEMGDDFYFTDDITASGARFIREHAEDPFFLYMAYTAPHWPLQAREHEIAKYRARFRAGWTRLREERLARLREIGLVESVDEIPATQATPGWSDEEAEWQVERMAVYAAQVESLDRGVGELLDALEQTGQADDTIVIFSSDNGGCAEELTPGMSAFNELVCPRTTPDGRPVAIGNDPSIMPGSNVTYQSYGRDWATVSNTPFRMWKRWVHEGGISTPFIVSWPGGGVPTGGDISHSTGHIVDIVATVMDAVGGEHDTEGTSLLEAWRNPAETYDSSPMFWEHVGNAAVRRGRWKLVREWGSPWELYEIAVDRGESRDLARELPELVNELAELWQNWADTHGVIPWEDVLVDHDERGIPRAHAVG